MAVALMVVALSGCVPPSSGGPGVAQPPSVVSPKTITIATLVPIPGFGPWDIGTTQGGWAALGELASNGLVTEGSGRPELRIAAQLPSFDDESIALLPDGRMQVTWHLRPDVRWHDGAPFTSDDLAFSVQMYQHPELPKGNTASTIGQIQRVETPDPLTAIITWRSAFAGGASLDLRTLWPYPSHLLGEAFQGDKQTFRGLPYFNTDYVGLGPFRLVDFGQGESQTFERFDNYYLGKPKIDRVIVRAIPDPNALYVNIKAGAVDMTPDQTMPLNLFLQLRDEWQPTGEGNVLQRQGIWRYLMVQLRPEFARVPEVARDVHLRRGLLLAIDRDALRESVLPGVANTSADSFMAPSDPRAPLVGQPFAALRYDPNRALAEFSEGGWRVSPDGRISNAAGERVEIPIRTSVQYPQEIAIVADYWRKLGLGVVEETASAAQAQDSEYKAKFPQIDVSGRGFNEAVLQYFDSRLIAAPENRWLSANVPGYNSPAFDRLVDQVSRSFDQREQGEFLRQAGEMLATDLPVLPTYFAVWLAAVRQPIQALRDDYAPVVQATAIMRHAYLWDLA